MKRFLVTLVALILLAGCASAGGKLVLVEDRVTDNLQKVDAGLRTACTSGAPSAVCQEARKALLDTVDVAITFNRCVANQQSNCLSPMIESSGRLISTLRKLPEGDSAKLILFITESMKEAVKLLGGRS